MYEHGSQTSTVRAGGRENRNRHLLSGCERLIGPPLTRQRKRGAHFDQPVLSVSVFVRGVYDHGAMWIEQPKKLDGGFEYPDHFLTILSHEGRIGMVRTNRRGTSKQPKSKHRSGDIMWGA